MGTLELFLSICGGISIVGGAVAIIWKWIAPAVGLVKKVNTLENSITATEQRLNELEKMQKMQSKCLAAIINHMITGNGVDHMKEIRDELLQSIIDN